MKRPRAGVCRFCGCTERNACGIYLPLEFDTVTCAWVDATRTCCSNVRCIDAKHREEGRRMPGRTGIPTPRSRQAKRGRG